MKTMYPAQVNSPGTELAGAIDAAQDTIQVADGSVLPDGPNLLTIGTDEAAETILYTGKTGDELTGVTRGFQGTAQSWAAGTKVARYFTAYDHDAAVNNISELSTGLKALGDAARDRLDIEVRQDVVLNSGMQILNAQRRASFSLSGIKGRTLANRLGRKGSLDSKTDLGEFQVDLFVETTDKVQGTGSLKVTLETGEVNGAGFIGSIDYLSGKYYVVVANVKNVNATNGYIGLAQPVVLSNLITDTTKWSTAFFRFNSATNHTSNLDFAVRGLGGQSVLFDAARIYEISKDAYDEIPNLTPEQVAAKYPYVDSVQPVRNPYAIRYGENLLPPFYEWTWGSSYVVNVTEPYAATLIRTAAGQNIYKDLPIVAGKYYTISWEHDSAVQATVSIQFYDKAGNAITGSGVNGSTELTVTALAPQEAVTVRIVFSGDIGSIPFKNPMLVVGSQPKPFKPREDSMLALQTDLYADPLTGANADEVFEKDGQYFKLAKWKSLILDGSINWGMIAPFTGFKRLGFPHQDKVIERSAIAVKYDGKILPEYGSVDATDKVTVDGLNLYVWVSNADTGWGDNYTPTPEERKAYFMGWKMYPYGGSGTATQTYDGTGTKGWCYRIDGVRGDTTGALAGATTTLPTTMAPNWTPYQLVYQLATSTVEPIVSEGMLTFNEGDNQVEVGTGIVVRESAKFVSNGSGSFTFNSNVPGATYAKFKVKDFIEVQENNKRKYGTIKTIRTVSNGTTLDIPDAIYDKTAVYSVTYLMLDTSPIVPFIGSYAANEKAMLQELTEAVQQNATAVSVLMSKKADKDSPGWITPTLLNGWVNYGSNDAVAGFYKDSDGMVYIRGTVKSGVVGGPNEQCTVFILPPGYRPSNYIGFATVANNGTADVAGRLNVDDGGRVIAKTGGNTWFGINIPPFLAEK